jgi:putative transposase
VSKDNIIQLIQPTNVDDQLTEILRTGARALLAQAVEAEVADFLGKYADLKTADGHQRVVRHGHLPEREVMTGIGPVAVRQPRVRDREADATDPDRIRFSPSILPPYNSRVATHPAYGRDERRCVRGRRPARLAGLFHSSWP